MPIKFATLLSKKAQFTIFKFPCPGAEIIVLTEHFWKVKLSNDNVPPLSLITPTSKGNDEIPVQNVTLTIFKFFKVKDPVLITNNLETLFPNTELPLPSIVCPAPSIVISLEITIPEVANPLSEVELYL